jgi:uncharacterized membrane protein YhiD involved in acid resistance
MRKLVLKYPQFLILAIVCLCATLYFNYVFKPISKPINPLEEEATKTKLQRIEDDKKALQIKVLEEETKSKDLLLVVDSLENLKPKIKVKYVTKYKDIDTANATALVKEFDSLFSSHNLK